MDLLYVGVGALAVGLVAGVTLGRHLADSAWVRAACEGRRGLRTAYCCRGKYYVVIPASEFDRDWQLRPVRGDKV